MRDKVIGADTPPGLTILHEQYGERKPGFPGHEHFGFLDGMGQPALRGVYLDETRQKAYFSPRTISKIDPIHNDYAFPGQKLVWPGAFIFGHTIDPARPVPKSPDWVKGGSLLAYRRLKQDVAQFWNFIEKEASNTANFPLGITEDKLASLLVGRWPGGAPLMRSLTDDLELGAAPESNNNFFYMKAATPTPLRNNGDRPDKYEVAPSDREGIRCPFASHIRKTEPRDHGFPPHPIIRRGSPYGPAIADDHKDDGVDRGLLFLSYQNSITQGTQFHQQTWANNPDFPVRGAGHDFLIGQPKEAREFLLRGVPTPDGGTKEVRLRTAEKWVTPTGGGHLFVPPILFFAGPPFFPAPN